MSFETKHPTPQNPTKTHPNPQETKNEETSPTRQETRQLTFSPSSPSLLWGLSTLISVVSLKYYNTNGMLPGYDNLSRGRTHTMNSIDPDKAAFSTGPVDEEAYAPLGAGRNDHSDDDEHEFNAGPYGGAPVHPGPSASPYGGGMGAGSMPAHDSDPYGHQDTSYGGAASSMGSRYDVGGESYAHVNPTPPPAGTGLYSPPAVHDDDDLHGPVQFPAGNYGNIGFERK